MQKIFRVGATAATVVFLMASAALAQTPDPAPAPAPAPAAAAPAPEPAAPAATPAVAPRPSAVAPAPPTPETEPAKSASGSHVKKPSHRMSRNAEIDRSINNGTVPARYRRSVPREYQQYIPFDRR